MTTRHQVTCIIPHQTDERRIHAVGGPDDGGWMMLEADAIRGLLSSAFTLFTFEAGSYAEVQVMENGHLQWLQTVADGVPTNNLSRLPRCPITYRQVA